MLSEVVILAWSAGAAVWIALQFSRSQAARSHRVLRKARVTPIAELVDGQLACIVGTVEVEGEPLLSMVSKKDCVAYDTVVQFFTENNHAIPERVEVERRLVPFFVVDATGRARIDAPEAALCNRPIARSDRFEERIIAPGAKVRLVGSVVLEPTIARGEHGFREGGWKATLTGSAKYPLLIDLDDAR